ncbi:MAG: ABC transporter permease [Eubacteriaceae bacterium]|nr:ABC transporter permease [Eubacteriaceae bacterium]
MSNRTFLKALRKNGNALAGAAGVGIILCLGLFAPLIAPFPAGYTIEVLQPPSTSHFFGTDKLGLDVFAQIIWGARTSLQVSLIAVAVSGFIGIPLGLVSGYFNGKAGAAIDLAIEVFLTLPVLALMIVAAAALGASITAVAVLIGLFAWPSLARVCRNTTLKVSQTSYIEAAKCSGLPVASILFKHILANIIGPVIVNLTMAMAGAILSESGLSFLGLGDPATWSWGLILKKAWEAGAVLASPNPWWWWLFPSLFIMIYVVSFNLLGNGINDALNPKGQ